MDYSTHTSKVTVEYTDPSGIYPVISRDLHRHLPLRNLHWNSATRPLRSIASLHIDLVKAGTKDASLATSEQNDTSAHSGAAGPGEHRDAVLRDNQRGSGAGTKRERRHQIPGLRQTPYLKLFFLRCSDVESYRATYRKELREWIRDNTPPSQSTASVNTQEFHDAFEWLIVHVVLPDDGRSISRAAYTSKNDVRNGYRGSDAVTEKLRADFNGTSKTAIDRVAQVQITRDAETISTTPQNQDSGTGWSEFVAKAKSLILSSFDLRVTQYEEDIKEKDAQKNIPGWNFNTFFVLKEGLARGFESVGLVEDALTGYQELAAGLSAIIESHDGNDQQQDLFKGYTDDLSAELKRVLQAEQPQYLYETKSTPANTPNGDAYAGKDRAILGSDILDTDRKPFRELILANEISVFDFRCYLFAREISLLLRLARGSEKTNNVNGTSTDRSENADIVPEAGESSAKDLLLLSEICRRAVNFFALASRLIRDDLRGSIDPLSKGHAKVAPSSVFTVDDPIEDIVASWIYSACQCILDITNVSSLTTQMQVLLRALKPSDEAQGDSQAPSRVSSRGGLPQRTSSLSPIRTSPRPSAPEVFPAVTFLDAVRLLPPMSTLTGTQELAAQRAELVSLMRRVVTGLGRRSGFGGFRCADLGGSLSSDKYDMEEVSLDDPQANAMVHENKTMTLNARQRNNLQNRKLSQSLSSEDAYIETYENFTMVALALNVLGERRRSAESLTADLAAVRFRMKNYISAASYFHQLATFYYNNDWTRLEISMLNVYAQALKCLDGKQDFSRVGLQLLAKRTSRKGISYISPEEGVIQETSGLSHYLQDVLNASKSLDRPLSAPIHRYFGEVVLNPYICHYEERDGFYMLLNLQSQMPEALTADEVRVKIVNVNDEQPMWMNTATTELLQPGPNQIVVQTTSTCPGWYRLERIDVRSANIVFTYDKATPMSNALFGAPKVTDENDHINEANSAPILVWLDERALEARISLYPSIHLGKPRSLRIVISSSRNMISQGKISLRACSAGLRLHTADADVQTCDSLILRNLQAGLLEFGALDANSHPSIRIPYDLESDLAEIKVKAEISYTVDGKEYCYIYNSELPIQLPLSVNVQDSFQDQALFSNFKIDTANSIPARISDYCVQGTRSLQVVMLPMSGDALTIFARQPLSLVAKVERERADTQERPIANTDEMALMLEIRYACLDQEIKTTVEDTLSTALYASQFHRLSRLVVGTFDRMLQSKFTVQDLEAIALLGEIHMGPFHNYDWGSMLDGLHPEKRTGISSWLKEWHAVRILAWTEPCNLLTVLQKNTSIRLPQGIDSRNVLELIVPVEMPPVPIVVTARLEISGSRIGPGEAQFAAVDQALLAEVALQYSRNWDNGSTGFTIEDELEITYEVQASPDIWLAGNPMSFSIILIPQRTGYLQYPSLEVRMTRPQGSKGRFVDSKTAAKEIITSELDYVNQAESILVIPNLNSSTVSLDCSDSGDGAWLVESRSR
ncbi:MAG: hypothetical protein Q9188_000344 [Gyalolechia gomerana]